MTQIIGKQIYFVLPHSPCSHWNTLSLSLSPHLSLSLSLSLSHSLQGYTLLFILWFPKNLNRFPFPIFELLKLRQFLHRSEVFSDLVVAKSFSEREKWVRSSTPTSTSMTLTSIGNHHFLLSLLYFNENLFLVRECLCVFLICDRPYSHVVLPPEVAKLLPKNRLLSEVSNLGFP